MDDILLAGQTPELLAPLVQDTISSLATYGLEIAPEKVQKEAPWTYLGWKILEHTVEPQSMALQTPVKTLNDLQKLLGAISWVRTLLGISNEKLAPLFVLLKGNPDLTSQHVLIPKAQEALAQLSHA